MVAWSATPRPATDRSISAFLRDMASTGLTQIGDELGHLVDTREPRQGK